MATTETIDKLAKYLMSDRDFQIARLLSTHLEHPDVQESPPLQEVAAIIGRLLIANRMWFIVAARGGQGLPGWDDMVQLGEFAKELDAVGWRVPEGSLPGQTLPTT